MALSIFLSPSFLSTVGSHNAGDVIGSVTSSEPNTFITLGGTDGGLFNLSSFLAPANLSVGAQDIPAGIYHINITALSF